MTALSPVPAYPWPQGKASAFCFSVDVDAHAPWLWANRADMPRLLGHHEQRGFGPRIGIPRIAALLAAHGIKGSFFVPAIVAETHPWMLPALVDAGHEVGLHGYFHELVAQVSDDQFTHFLEGAIGLFQAQTGQKPRGFRSPAWEMTPHMLAECRRLDLYDSSLMGLETPHSVNGVTQIPVSWSTDDAIFFKFLGGGGDMSPPLGTDAVYRAWTEELQASRRYGTLMMLTVHDWISGKAVRAQMLDKLLGHVIASPDIWIATAGELAAHHRAHAPERDALTVSLPRSPLEHPAWKDA